MLSERPRAYVVDASVAVKWFLHEEDSEKALGIASSEIDLMAPTLLFVEVANALGKRVRRKELSRADAIAAYRDLVSAPIARIAVDEQLTDEALELATVLSHSVQDCIYLAVAMRRDTRLLTADRNFAKAARTHPETGRLVVLLEEVTP